DRARAHSSLIRASRPQRPAVEWARRPPSRLAMEVPLMLHHVVLALAATVVAASLPARAPGHAEPELGCVHWGRDVDTALGVARSSKRPVLVLFDEVPGCATCVGFGQQVLAHPLLSEAIETEFVPVFVANSRPGRDAEQLARFGEPAWNNPVLR